MSDEDIVKKAIEKAKELEKTPLPSDDEILELHKDASQKGEELKKLLKSEWFLRDTDEKITEKKSARRKNL